MKFKKPIVPIEVNYWVDGDEKTRKFKDVEEALTFCAYMEEHEQYDKIWKTYVVL